MIQESGQIDDVLIGKIPVANIWLLFLYAYGLAQFQDEVPIQIEDDDADLPSLVAKVLIHAVEQRLRRNLSRGYRAVTADLGRVRGRIDCLATFGRDMLQHGQVRCRFEDLTMNTPRNRYVRSALVAMGNRLTDRKLSHECRRLAADLGRLGVNSSRPSRSERALDVINRNELHDRLMVALADLTFDLALPTEQAGGTQFTSAFRRHSAQQFGQLFERAVRAFYEIELRQSDGWRVSRGKILRWPATGHTTALSDVLPSMMTDIVIDDLRLDHRLVVDTKATPILKRSWKRTTLDAGYLYQIYTYLRSQEERDDWWREAEGLMIHPTVDDEFDEAVMIQGHRFRFATVNLMSPTMTIRNRLLQLVTR